MNNRWVKQVISKMKQFAHSYSVVYSKKPRQISAAFEIGCFLTLVTYYEKVGCKGIPKNLDANGEYRYLTTPNGNPSNFSYVFFRHKNGDEFEMRQQVRVVCSHFDDDISFTPDIVLIRGGAQISDRMDKDYASGKRRYFFVTSQDVIAAHECKSLPPFPELLVSFLGLVIAAHSWVKSPNDRSMVSDDGYHLAPALFVGGTARGLHLRMVASLKDQFPINIVLGLHSGTWDLFGEKAILTIVDV